MSISVSVLHSKLTVLKCEPLQVQRHLQLRIEAQGKYLQSVLETAQETLGRQNLGIVGLEDTKVQLSELVSKVSSQCLNSAFQEVKELQAGNGICTNQPNDCSMDNSSCLTSCDRSQKDHQQDIQNGLRHFNGHMFMERKEQATETTIPLGKNNFLTPLGKNNNEERSNYGNLSMSIGLERETQKTVDGSNYFAASRLDLNTRGDNSEAANSCCKQLDLNRFSWN